MFESPTLRTPAEAPFKPQISFGGHTFTGDVVEFSYPEKNTLIELSLVLASFEGTVTLDRESNKKMRRVLGISGPMSRQERLRHDAAKLERKRRRR